MPDRVLFYEGSWYCFSNFSSFRVLWRGTDWMTAEHAYQSAKFSNPDIITQIREAPSAYEAKKIAHAQQYQKIDLWEEIKLEVMEGILRAKLKQHPYIQKKLFETGRQEIVENSPADSFWGRGPDWKGQNWLGKIWMKLRAELQGQSASLRVAGGGA